MQADSFIILSFCNFISILYRFIVLLLIILFIDFVCCKFYHWNSVSCLGHLLQCGKGESYSFKINNQRPTEAPQFCAATGKSAGTGRGQERIVDSSGWVVGQAGDKRGMILVVDLYTNILPLFSWLNMPPFCRFTPAGIGSRSPIAFGLLGGM